MTARVENVDVDMEVDTVMLVSSLIVVSLFRGKESRRGEENHKKQGRAPVRLSRFHPKRSQHVAEVLLRVHVTRGLRKQEEAHLMA
jgi:hypothetical protein